MPEVQQLSLGTEPGSATKSNKEIVRERSIDPDEFAPEALAALAEERLADEKLTPMMRQYLSVKLEHPHALILFRMGDFFETFYEDAQLAAKLLGVTLTARSKEKDPTPMAGVPHHAVDGYLARLTELGRTVVMVDQVEDPKLAKGLVRREVTRILTPGTYQPAESQPMACYLAALALDKRTEAFGLALMDVSTGEFRATHTIGLQRAIDELERVEVRELLVSESFREDPRIANLGNEVPCALTWRPVRDFGRKSARGELSENLGTDLGTVESMLSPEAMAAAAACLHFAKETQVRKEAVDRVGHASLGHVRPLRPYNLTDHLVLDREARAHLELFKTQRAGKSEGALLTSIDATKTAMGRRLLREWLAYPLTNLDGIGARQVAVQALLGAPEDLVGLRQQLSEVYDLERLLSRLAMGRASPRDLSALQSSLAVVPKMLAHAQTAADKASPKDGAHGNRLRAIARADACADVLGRLTGALHESPAVDVSKGHVFCPGFDAALDELTGLAQHGQQRVGELEVEERKRTNIPSLKIRSNKVFGYFIEVTKTYQSQVPERFVRKQTMVNAERYITDELKELEQELSSASERRLARTKELFEALTQDVQAELSRLGNLARALAELDVLLSFARVAEERSYCCPTVVAEGALTIQEGRHPVVEEFVAAESGRFVPNDVTLDNDSRLTILTGPNMAGKSTVMRQTALISLLAHVGAFVPAKSAQIPLMDRIFTRVGASDELAKGRSTFMVEMHETAKILRMATAKSLVVIDEVGRGTSTFDGLAIAWAVCEWLHKEIRSKTLFATHFHELTAIAAGREGIVNRHIAVRKQGKQVVFLRKLADGPTDQSYGVDVARLAGLPAPVVVRAEEMMRRLEEGGLETVSSLPLIDVPIESSTESQVQSEQLQPIAQEIAALPLDDWTPRQAFQWLVELQARIGEA